MKALPRNQVLVGDAVQRLRQLPAGSVDMVLTSPPYFGLRNYQIEGQLGREESIEQWVAALRGVAGRVGRVLTPTGTLWLNVADSYAIRDRDGAQRKSLLLGPARLALGLAADGWLVRNQIVWAKTNPMPFSVRDRLSASYELILLLARSRHYFFDLHAVRVPHLSRAKPQPNARTSLPPAWRGRASDTASGLAALKRAGIPGHVLGKNPGDVWRFATSNYRGGHFATYPVDLAERAIRAGCPEVRCRSCRIAWRRSLLRPLGGTAVRGALGPGCGCGAPSEPGLVLDPFFGSGTTGVAAERLSRDWLGVELNPAFAAQARQRIERARPPAEAA